jgi:pimeloyl-ACP methyl ester carboxylesterase
VRPRRVTVVVVAIGALLVGCNNTTAPRTSPSAAVPTVTTPATAATTEPTTSTSTRPTTLLSWSGCGGFECARLTVPLDYDHPDGPTVQLPVLRLPASSPAQRIGSLVTDPGGPGGSGVDFVRGSGPSLFDVELRRRFDIVGFDPRGVGGSTPAVHCLDGSQMDRYLALDPSPDTAAERTAFIQGNKDFADACVRRTGALLRHVGTLDAARDLDRLRAALGDDKLTYLGFSYGTYLGAVYANLFPTHIRALVLDGAVDPSLDAEQSSLEQAKGFDVALQAFLSFCATSPSCEFRSAGSTGPELGRAFDTLMASIDRHPLPTASGRVLGPGEASLGAAAALYSRERWPILGTALSRAQSGDGSVLLALSDSLSDRHRDGSYGNLFDVLNAVNCLDKPAPRDLRRYDADAAQFAKAAPRFGAALAYGTLTCGVWPVAPTPVPPRLTARGAPPIVVVGTTRDPATPYAGAQSLAGQLATGVLLTFDGDGHTAYGQNPCINSAVDDYLLTGGVPAKGTVCR